MLLPQLHIGCCWTDADVTAGKNDNTIIIAGSEDAVELAEAAILQTVNGGQRGGKLE